MMTMMNRIRRIPLLLLPKKNTTSVFYNRTSSATTTAAAEATTTVTASAASQLMSHRSASYYALNYYNTSSSSPSLIHNHNTKQTGKNGNRNHNLRPFQLHSHHQQSREFGTKAKKAETRSRPAGVRISTLLSKHLGLSRRQSERMILTERVTLFGKIVNSPAFELRPSNDPNQNSKTAMKVDGKLISDVEDTLKVMYAELQLQQQQNEADGGDGGDGSTGGGNDNRGKRSDSENYSNTRIWLANKLKGELITEDDPVGRPSMLQRLTRGGVGKPKKSKTKSGNNAQPLHLKPIGRLDMMTEGLMIFTNDGQYARQLELPTNKLWRTYRARVHGRLTEGKLRAMRKGLTVRVNDNNNMFGGNGNKGKNGGGGGEDKKASGEVVNTGRLMKYKGIKVSIERKNLSHGRGRGGGGGTNTWLRITCTEGKNRQLRRILDALGLDVTRLIRVSYGDYDLNTIPPGMAVEVPCKGFEGMSKQGRLFARSSSKKKEVKEEDREERSAVQWVTYS